MTPFSIYVHVPFCMHRCPYCDFNTYAVSELPERAYVNALLAELDMRAALPEWQGRPVQTIYFGGGTPSLFSANSIDSILTAIRARFPTLEAAEISLEANPGTVTTESLSGYFRAGVNRLSFGAQSFAPAVLKQLGRIHSPEQTVAAVESARSAGFTNISLDLMYGCPDQTLPDVAADVNQAIALAPMHISIYGLTIEKGTEYYTRFHRGILPLPTEDIVLQMMQTIEEILPKQGFARYEISNFALPTFHARHNLAYWNGDDYLGLGAGAHSFCRHAALQPYGKRWASYALPSVYIDHASSTGRAEAWSEELTLTSAMFEFFFLGLRKVSGVRKSSFSARFGIPPEAAYPRVLPLLIEGGMLTEQNDTLALSPRGLLLMDSVIENFANPESPAAT